MRKLEEASGLDPWQTSNDKLKAAIHTRELVEVPPQDTWRIEYLCSLLRKHHDAVSLAFEDLAKQLQDLIDSLVI